MLEVENLRVTYGVTEVIRDVSFCVQKNSVTALLGGNGAGKTSILNALSGLIVPSAGEIYLESEKLTGKHPADIVRQGMVQVPQGRFVWPKMTVEDNLRLGAVTRRREETATDRDRIFGYFPVLKEKLYSPAGALSGGEQQMVAIGRALMARPRFLLMDEPSAGLSPVILDTMIDAIKLLASEGLPILLVEQNIGVAEACSDQAIVLANGEIAFQAAASGLTENPEIFASYFGR